jgi:hypothetical protein
MKRGKHRHTERSNAVAALASPVLPRLRARIYSNCSARSDCRSPSSRMNCSGTLAPGSHHHTVTIREPGRVHVGYGDYTLMWFATFR